MMAYDRSTRQILCVLFSLLFAASPYSDAQAQGTVAYQATAKDNARTDAFIERIGLGDGVRTLLLDASFILDFSPDLAVFYFHGDFEDHEASHIDALTKVSRDVAWWKDRQAAYRLRESTVFVPGDHLLTYSYGNGCETAWQLTGEQQRINGYACYKALGEDIHYSSRGDSVFRTPVEAWYCPDLPVPYGPEKYGGLPGMILKLDNGLLVYECVSIDLDSQPEVPESPEAVKIDHVEFLRQFNQQLDGMLKKIKNNAREDDGT